MNSKISKVFLMKVLGDYDTMKIMNYNESYNKRIS